MSWHNGSYDTCSCDQCSNRRESQASYVDPEDRDPELWRVRATKPAGFVGPLRYSHSMEGNLRNLIRDYPHGAQTVTVPFFSEQTARNQATMARKAGLTVQVIPCAVIEQDPLP